MITLYKPHIKARMVTRIIIILLDVMIFGLLGFEAARGPIKISGDESDGDEHDLYLIAFVVPTWSIVIAAISFVLLYSHIRDRSAKQYYYHPGWDVAADLVAWLVMWTFGSMFLAAVTAPESEGYCLGAVREYDYCNRPGVVAQIGARAATASFMLINGLLHFCWFIRACRVTKKFRRDQVLHHSDLRVAYELQDENLRNDPAGTLGSGTLARPAT